MVPSSFWISQITAAGSHPAKRAKSTPASVCPARLSTPPLRARNGKIWPGRANDLNDNVESDNPRSVAARSAALIPVVVPSMMSTVSVNAVRWLSVFCSTISGRRNSSQRSSVNGAHTTPVEYRTMNASFSAEANSAAMMKSPSFSRSSSSTMTTISPRAIAAITSSMGARVESLMMFLLSFVWGLKRFLYLYQVQWLTSMCNLTRGVRRLRQKLPARCRCRSQWALREIRTY